MSTATQPGSLVDTLTDRQTQVLRMVADGATNPEIADALDVSLDGAKWHLREIFAKLGVDSREEAAQLWRAHQSFAARSKRALAALFTSTAIKVAAGAAGLAAVGLVVVAAGLGRPDDPGVEAQPAPQASLQVEAWVRVEGLSMAPALTGGQRYPLDVLAYLDDPPATLDIVAFVDPRETDPRRPTSVLVKRVIGVAGDTIEISNGVVILNGEPLAEDYVAGAWADSLQRLEVPEDSFFVLGDNRTNSLDSRNADIGVIPGDLILGKVVLDPADPRGPERHDLNPTPPAP